MITIFFVIFCFLLIKNSTKTAVVQMETKEKVDFVKIGGKILKVDLAINKDEQAKGLSGRKKIEKETGMLFVFEKPSINYFWMKDMSFPIDIIWINESFKIINIEKNIKPESYPTTFGPKENSMYVLEVEAGFAEKNNLKVGEKIDFLP